MREWKTILGSAPDALVDSAVQDMSIEELCTSILQETTGVSKESQMSLHELYQAMGGIVVPGFCGLQNMNYVVPIKRQDNYQLGIAAKLESPLKIANKARISGNDVESLGFKAFDLRYHQLSGIHRILSHISAPSETPNIGILIADDVGLGKTAQALGVIAQLIHWRELEEENKPLPPVHGKAFYHINIIFFNCLQTASSGGVDHWLYGIKPIPRGPHIIVAPPPLIPYWMEQIGDVLGSQVDVILYKRTLDKRRPMFAPESRYSQSKLPEHRRIILCSSFVSWNSTIYTASAGVIYTYRLPCSIDRLLYLMQMDYFYHQ